MADALCTCGQARAKGGELPGLYNAFVHIDLNLGLIRRILYQVS